jgi:3-oxoacyl-[acyl-carrier-protein] synthase-1
VASASEPNRIITETVCIGEGLTRALRRVLGALPPGAQVSDVYCDMNGEPYRADEYGFTALRIKQQLEAASEFVAPADCWGDVGAASGPLGLMLAAIAGHKAYSRGPIGLVWASSEGGERAGALLQT